MLWTPIRARKGRLSAVGTQGQNLRRKRTNQMDLTQLPKDALETLSYHEGFSQGTQIQQNIPEALQAAFLKGFTEATSQKLDEEAMMYAAGGHTARQATQQGLNADKMLAGIQDQLEERPRAYTDEQVAAAFQLFQQLQQQSQSNAGANAGADAGAPEGAAQENLARGQAFLAENAGNDAVTTTDSGLQFQVIEPGKGDKPVASDTVTVHYTGRLLDGTVFDSSVQRGEPIDFPLNRVIPGWTEGVQLMSPGAKYRFWIPANLAYGENAPPAIGPNQVLDFDVELLKVGN